MKSFELKGVARQDVGKKAATVVRGQGLIPCVVYGGEDVVHFSVTEESVRGLIYTPNVYVVELVIDGKKITSIMKDIQFHPVSDKVLHIDFIRVSADKPVIVNVPIEVSGFAEGVKAGGKLQTEMRYLKVKGLYSNIPDRLHIDVTTLGLGKTIQVGALSYENIELLNTKNAVVVSVKLTRAARAKQES